VAVNQDGLLAAFRQIVGQGRAVQAGAGDHNWLRSHGAHERGCEDPQGHAAGYPQAESAQRMNARRVTIHISTGPIQYRSIV